MFKKLIVILILLAVFLAGCVQKQEEIKLESVKNCECHTQPWNYKSHVHGDLYCLKCHEVEKHPKINFTRYTFSKNCSRCHGTKLLQIHMPNVTCVDCHGDVRVIHEKFEKRFLEGAK